ncbi:hypothetical protein JW711_04595 [Candidatus Woesearchaeota archaeon]|nr:hypothetical protein [Candidatus Woesearchaeota archaeon]
MALQWYFFNAAPLIEKRFYTSFEYPFFVKTQGLVRKRFLGVDESNHGRIPEIFVGAYSNNPLSLNPTSLEKSREFSPVIMNVESNALFYHLVFSADFIKALDSESLKVVAIAELVHAVEGLETVVYDGELREHKRQCLCRLISPNVNLIVVPHADETYPLVNKADNLANLIHKYYAVKGGPRSKYNSHEIEPDLDYYLRILK